MGKVTINVRHLEREDLEDYGAYDEIIFGENTEEIGVGVFFGNTQLTRMETVGVKTIKDSSFSGCINLKDAVFSKTLSGIGNYSFKGCKSLQSITIPKDVIVIENGSFMNCESLESVVIEEGVRKIGDHAFCYCTKLKRIILPESIESISPNAFAWCNKLEIFSAPKLKNLGKHAFWGCHLKTIDVPSNHRLAIESAGYAL